MQEQTSVRQHQGSELDRLASRLEASGDYKVLRRLVTRQPTAAPADSTDKIGIVLDVETTGLDLVKDEIVELAMVKFYYSRDGEITGVSGSFQAFRQPSVPIPAAITKLTGITDEMVAGHKIDVSDVDGFVAEADIIIAHNAQFDRRFAEKAWPVFARKNWACSVAEIDWKMHGFDGAKLGYLLAGCGLFHDAHRAVDDCNALLEILARPLPGTAGTALAALLERARRNTVRIWAKGAPFDLKDELKWRGYRWSAGLGGRPRAWYIDVDDDKHEAELRYLRTEIYRRDNVDVPCHQITARNRHSARV